MTKPVLAYIGVGLMGLPMVRHLAPKGYKITAFDIARGQLDAAAKAGATIAASPAAAVSGADIVVTNLPTGAAVESVVFGDGGVAKAMRPPQRLVDFSTIPVEQGRDSARRLREISGCGWVDAPVSGGPPASGTGTLTVMVGGEPADIDAVRPFLADISQRYTIMGGPGSGLVTKMINQMIVGSTHAVLAEALVVAESAGIDASKLPECLAGGFADSPLLQKLYPRMVKRDFAPQGYARQLLKDLEMVSVFAGGMKAPIPITSEALNLYRILCHLGHSELDTAALVKIYGVGEE